MIPAISSFISASHMTSCAVLASSRTATCHTVVSVSCPRHEISRSTGSHFKRRHKRSPHRSRDVPLSLHCQHRQCSLHIPLRCQHNSTGGGFLILKQIICPSSSCHLVYFFFDIWDGHNIV
jgi:hypothetical protein